VGEIIAADVVTVEGGDRALADDLDIAEEGLLKVTPVEVLKIEESEERLMLLLV